YLILETLGKNPFSETFLGADKGWFSRRRYVIKKLRPILGNPLVENMRRSFYQEASILKRLSGNNPQIPQLYDYFLDGEDFYLVREWIDGMTLKQKVEKTGRLPVSEVKEILASVLSFLQYIHDYGIVYRQLKPSTIILRRGCRVPVKSKSCLPVPIYFGGVKELEAKTEHLKQYSLTTGLHQEYIPPEQEQGESVFASDLYSLGLTAIYLLTGKNPAELLIKTKTKQLCWHQDIASSEIHLVRVIERAICPDVKERFTSAEEMLQALHSPPVNLSLPVFKEKPQNSVSSELKIISLLCSVGIGVLGLTFAILNLDLGQKTNDEQAIAKAYQTDSPLSDTLILDPEILDSDLPQPATAKLSATELTMLEKIPPFPLGMPQQDLFELLGQPMMNSKGYWGDSRALLYGNILPDKIALGYITDTATTSVRQAEIAFSNSVGLPTIKFQAQKLLQENYSPEIDHYINQIYFKTSDRHQFETNNIKGVIQLNPNDQIYLGIWDKEFH
ncbi:MAG: serine/threonine-protein kinase, partial [Cyanobacteria bacterium J06631_2]